MESAALAVIPAGSAASASAPRPLSRRTPWGVADLILVPAGTTLLTVWVLIVAAVVASALGIRLRHLYTVPPLALLGGLVVLLAASLVATIHIDVVRRLGLSWRAIGLRWVGWRGWGDAFLASLALTVAYPGVAMLAAMLRGRTEISLRGAPPLLNGADAGLPWLFVGLAVLGPIAEELFFRGLLYRYVRSRTGRGAAIMLSAALYAALHLVPLVMPFACVLGLACAWLAERHDSLLPGIAVHVLNNGLVLVALTLLPWM